MNWLRGTILLDEIGELAPEMQAKFARIAGKEIQRIGGSTVIKTDQILGHQQDPGKKWEKESFVLICITGYLFSRSS